MTYYDQNDNTVYYNQGFRLKIRVADLLPEIIFEPPLEPHVSAPEIIRQVIRLLDDFLTFEYEKFNGITHDDRQRHKMLRAKLSSPHIDPELPTYLL